MRDGIVERASLMAGVRITKRALRAETWPVAPAWRCRARPAVDARHRQRWQGPGRLRAARLAARDRADAKDIVAIVSSGTRDVPRARRGTALAAHREARLPVLPPAHAIAVGRCRPVRTLRRGAGAGRQDPGLSARPLGGGAGPGAGVAPSDPALRRRPFSAPDSGRSPSGARPTDRPAPAGRPPARCGFPGARPFPGSCGGSWRHSCDARSRPRRPPGPGEW